MKNKTYLEWVDYHIKEKSDNSYIEANLTLHLFHSLDIIDQTKIKTVSFMWNSITSEVWKYFEAISHEKNN